MGISWTITGGELLQIVTFLIAVFAAYNRLSITIAKVEAKLDTIYSWWGYQMNQASVDVRPMHKNNGD